MAVYPLYSELASIVGNMEKGNYGLWFNKFVPINNFNQCKASDETGNTSKPVELYVDKYGRINGRPVLNLLKQKHVQLSEYCLTCNDRYDVITLKATLCAPLVTGIGQSHPHEISMVFDRNLGVPFIPASSVKGIVRFASTLSILDDYNAGNDETVEINEDGFFKDEEHVTIRELFGNQEYRGNVVFLDAYPERVPELRIDIMNPHYGKYYSGEKEGGKDVPPRDNLEPNPIKFLTVAPGEVFIFRAVAKKELIEKVKEAFHRALEVEGVGAKTSLGYGRFTLEEYSDEWQSNKKSRVSDGKEVKGNDTPLVPGINMDDVVTAVLLEEKTKKGKWCARCKEDDSISGVIVNSEQVPGNYSAGQEVRIQVKVKGGDNSQFEIV